MKKNIYPKIFYDAEARVLRIQLRPGRSVDSDIEQNTVIDYDKQKNIVALEIMSFGLNEFKTFRSMGYRMPSGSMQLADKPSAKQRHQVKK
ncbi:MAG: DUF2283 domain-containing protein [Candidatus Sungbacteria bacterium]|nr:DUF2283 domain-containing protein [Candidatus Sungbacteria bacterium]